MPETRILLIEDDPAYAGLLGKMLSGTGDAYHLDTAATLGEGLSALGRGGYDLVLLDLGLPDSGGFETFERVSRAAPRIPIVVVTGLADDAVTARAVREGAHDVIEKGRVNVALLTRAVQHAVERKRFETERSRTEELLSTVFENMGEGLIVVDPSYRILSANRAYCSQFGVRPADVVGRTCHEVSHGRSIPCHELNEVCAVEMTLRTGKPHKALHTHANERGNIAYVETKTYPIANGNGKVSSVIQMSNDISEKVKLEEQLRHSQKLEAVGQLAGGIAHDFNNILTAIIGYTTILQMKLEKDSPLAAEANLVLHSAERAAGLTQSLLAFSRKQIINRRPININDVILRIERVLSRVIGEDIELVTRLGEEDCIVMADSTQMEQILMNLATNARDAMPRGGSLTIATRIYDLDDRFIALHGYGEKGAYVCITATDTGVGMDEKTRARIFEPFFTTKEVGKGTGLGLSIIYGIVKQHNGYVNAYSEPGQGSTFRVYLPLLSALPEDVALAETEPARGGTETILLAEDDAEQRRLTANLLQEFGYTVIAAADGIEALEKFRQHRDRIDLLILDVVMPRKNGREVYEEVKRMNDGSKVLFTSGYPSDVMHRRDIVQAGLEFISKPVTSQKLLRRIRALLDG